MVSNGRRAVALRMWIAAVGLVSLTFGTPQRTIPTL